MSVLSSIVPPASGDTLHLLNQVIKALGKKQNIIFGVGNIGNATGNIRHLAAGEAAIGFERYIAIAISIVATGIDRCYGHVM